MPLVALYAEVLLNTATPPVLQKNQAVTILNSDQVTNATLYANDAGTVSLGNPVTTTNNGTLVFRAVPGTYYPSVGGVVGDPIFVGVPAAELTTTRTPSAHASTHAIGGSDPLTGVGGATVSWTAVKTANYTAIATDAVPVDTTSGIVVVTLPTGNTNDMVRVALVAGANPVMVQVTSAGTINGASVFSWQTLNDTFDFSCQSAGVWRLI